MRIEDRRKTQAEPGIWLSSGGRTRISIRLTDCFEDFSCDVGLQQAQGCALGLSLIGVLSHELPGTTTVHP